MGGEQNANIGDDYNDYLHHISCHNLYEQKVRSCLMIYLDYERFKKKYLDTQLIFDSLLSEKETMLRNGRSDRKKLKQIDETLTGLKSTLEDREKLLRLKEDELRNSKNPDDIVYRLRFIEKMKVRRIARIIHYSDTQTYRILQSISETIDKAINS